MTIMHDNNAQRTFKLNTNKTRRSKELFIQRVVEKKYYIKE